MSEATKQEVESGVDSTQENVQTEESSIDVNELQKQLDSIKKAQQGSDRKVSELEKERNNLIKEVESLKTSSMSSEEKLNYEKELQAAKEKEFEQKLKALEQDNLKKDFMLKNSISPELSQYISGETEEQLSENAKTLLEGIKAEADKIVKEKLAGSPPKTGSPQEQTKNLTAEQIAEIPDPRERMKALEKAGYI